MAYTKTVWDTNKAANADRLNNLETQYEKILANINATHIGLGNVDNLSAQDIREGITKSDIGLGNVDNISAAAIRTTETRAFRMEVRADAPTSPNTGRIWMEVS